MFPRREWENPDRDLGVSGNTLEFLQLAPHHLRATYPPTQRRLIDHKEHLRGFVLIKNLPLLLETNADSLLEQLLWWVWQGDAKDRLRILLGLKEGRDEYQLEDSD